MPAAYAVMRPDDLPAVSQVLGTAFNFDPAIVPEWCAQVGHDNVRVMRDGREVMAALLLIPMGQFFGGQSVPMMGVAGVGTAVTSRGRGVGTALMAATALELHDRGVALSTLYPATETLYRRAGWAQAGTRFRVRVPLGNLPRGGRELGVRDYTETDRAAVEVLYAERARRIDGWIDRGSYAWRRVFQPREGRARAYVVLGDGGPEGYVAFYSSPYVDRRNELVVTDMIAATPAARGRILTLIADHASLATHVQWHGEAADDWIGSLPDQRYEIRVDHFFMTRITNVAAALEARGYAHGAAGRLELDVVDDVVPGNAGRLVLEVDSGRARVSPGGDGTLRVTIGGLASLYGAHLGARALVDLGQVQGPERALAMAESLFGGRPATMRDQF